MPSYRPYDNETKPWAARARRTYMQFWLGWFETEEEARQAERAFAEIYPPGKGGTPPWHFDKLERQRDDSGRRWVKTS